MAGYCWPWASKTDPLAIDIRIADYEAAWNKKSDGSLWAISENSVDQVGCIHTCQGLEFDYVGVIIGENLAFQDNKVVTQPLKRNSVDANKTLRGFKTRIRSNDPYEVKKAYDEADAIIRNTYKVLMTRGQKGCYIYCCDPALSSYIKGRIAGLGYYQTDTGRMSVAEDPLSSYPV